MPRAFYSPQRRAHLRPHRFLRTLVFQVAAVLLLPKIWELTGIWMSIVVAEFMAVVLSAIFLLLKRKKYSY